MNNRKTKFIIKIILLSLVSIVLIAVIVHFTRYPIYLSKKSDDEIKRYIISGIEYVAISEEVIWEFDEYNYEKIGYINNFFTPLYDNGYNENNYYYQAKDFVFKAPKFNVVRSDFDIPEYNVENIHELKFYYDYYSGSTNSTRDRKIIDRFYQAVIEDEKADNDMNQSDLYPFYICCYNDDLAGAEVKYEVYLIDDNYYLKSGTVLPDEFIKIIIDGEENAE